MEDQAEAMGDTMPAEGAFVSGKRQDRQTISHKRRIELQQLASVISAHVLETTKVHERCLLRRMVENLLPEKE